MTKSVEVIDFKYFNDRCVDFNYYKSSELFKGKQRLEKEEASIPVFPVIGQLSEFRCESRERTIGNFGTFWGDAKDPPPPHPRLDEGSEVVDEEKFLRRGSK